MRVRNPHAPTITPTILRLASAPSRLFAALRPRFAGLKALTAHSAEPCLGLYVMVGNLMDWTTERRHTMRELTITPGVTVTIGCDTRQYFAYITTAPAVFDSPATVTLQDGPFLDVIVFAGEPVPNENLVRRTARLVLIEAMELAWQRAKYRGHDYLFLAADPRLAGPNTLQRWLWQRLQAPTEGPVAA